MKNLLTFVLILLLGACSSPKIDGTNEETFKKSIQHISDSLSSSDREKFQLACLALAGDFFRNEIGKIFIAAFAGKDMSDAPNPEQAFYSKLNGKDYKQIITEADAIMLPKMQQDKEELTSLVKKLEEQLAQSLQSKEKISHITISNPKFYSKFNKTAQELGWSNPIFRDYFVEFDIDNGTSEAISSILLNGTIEMPGRTIPCFEGKINALFPGGLEPLEKQHFISRLNRWSDWAEAQNPKGSVLILKILEVYGAKNRLLWRDNFTEQEGKQLFAVKEKLQKMEQSGNDWYSVYKEEIQETMQDFSQWVMEN